MGNTRVNRNILIAVDESDNAGRAVDYVAELLGGIEGFQITLFHVIPDPEEDYFQRPQDHEAWLENYRKKIDSMLESFRRVLIDSGFSEASIRIRTIRKFCPSLAKCILQEREEANYGTIVIGRQGISRSEEFLFGSVSSKIVNHAKNCTVWVVA